MEIGGSSKEKVCKLTLLESFEVYIIYSNSKNRFYVGQTNCFHKRLIRHNKGMVKSTKGGIPWLLVTTFKVKSRKDAVVLEKKIKKRGARRYLNDQKITFGM